MAPEVVGTKTVARFKTQNLRWWICGLVFLVTVINYVDRQVFSILAPQLQREIGWSELDYGRIVIAFQLSYAVMQLVSGRIIDRIGTRLGFAVAIVGWSLAEMGHAIARTPMGFGIARFFLGLTEAANFPAAIKSISEWFPAKERSMATGIVISGVGLGVIVASIIVPLLNASMGWQATFVVTGAVGLIWLVVWLMVYWKPSEHPRINESERDMILAETGRPNAQAASVPWSKVMSLRQTWAYTFFKALADPVWWFYLFWLPKLLAEEFNIRGTAVIPYLTTVYVFADIGSLVGGWLSSNFIKRGWSLNAARKGTLLILAFILVPSILYAGNATTAIGVIIGISFASGAHQAWSAITYTAVSDLIPSQAVGVATGLGGMAAGLTSMLAAELTGRALQANPGDYWLFFLVSACLYPLNLLLFHLMTPKMEKAKI